MQKFETIYQKVSGELDNIFRDVKVPDIPYGEEHDLTKPSEELKQMWNGLSNEKMIGILHAFVLLKPSLFKSMKNCE